MIKFCEQTQSNILKNKERSQNIPELFTLFEVSSSILMMPSHKVFACNEQIASVVGAPFCELNKNEIWKVSKQLARYTLD